MRNRFNAKVGGLFGLGMLVATASAAPEFLVAVQPDNVTLPASTFTLSFGGGVDRQAIISRTDFVIEVDQAAGTARFRDYYQDIGSLELPGGIQTGAITVSIAPNTSLGTFDGTTFATNEIYNITFANDLSLFGLSSPVGLPGASGGTYTFVSGDTGEIALAWDGIGQLQNPADPSNPIIFQYNCTVRTRVMTTPACATTGCTAGDINGDCVSDLSDLAGMLTNFGTVGTAARSDGDVSGDGDVDLDDLSPMLSQFGSDCTQ
ncbi:MAG: hypothetical protein ACKVS9_08910 [Phycisphaerae bacterium]